MQNSQPLFIIHRKVKILEIWIFLGEFNEFVGFFEIIFFVFEDVDLQKTQNASISNRVSQIEYVIAS